MRLSLIGIMNVKAREIGLCYNWDNFSCWFIAVPHKSWPESLDSSLKSIKREKLDHSFNYSFHNRKISRYKPLLDGWLLKSKFMGIFLWYMDDLKCKEYVYTYFCFMIQLTYRSKNILYSRTSSYPIKMFQLLSSTHLPTKHTYIFWL